MAAAARLVFSLSGPPVSIDLKVPRSKHESSELLAELLKAGSDGRLPARASVPLLRTAGQLVSELKQVEENVPELAPIIQVFFGKAEQVKKDLAEGKLQPRILSSAAAPAASNPTSGDRDAVEGVRGREAGKSAAAETPAPDCPTHNDDSFCNLLAASSRASPLQRRRQQTRAGPTTTSILWTSLAAPDRANPLLRRRQQSKASLTTSILWTSLGAPDRASPLQRRRQQRKAGPTTTSILWTSLAAPDRANPLLWRRQQSKGSLTTTMIRWSSSAARNRAKRLRGRQ